MSDADLRELERRFRVTGSVEDEASWLLERVRAGDLTQERLELAAYCDYLPARKALPDPPECHHELAKWISCLHVRTAGRSGLTEAAARLALVLIVDWTVHIKKLTTLWPEVVGTLWRSWEFLPSDEVSRLQGLLKQRGLRAGEVEKLLLSVAGIVPRSEGKAWLRGWVSDLSTDHDVDCAVLGQVVRSKVARWALRVDAVEAWHIPRDWSDRAPHSGGSW